MSTKQICDSEVDQKSKALNSIVMRLGLNRKHVAMSTLCSWLDKWDSMLPLLLKVGSSKKRGEFGRLFLSCKARALIIHDRVLRGEV